MATLQESAAKFEALGPVITEIGADVAELKASVEELKKNSDPATIQKISDLADSMTASLTQVAAAYPPSVPPPPPPTEPPPATSTRRN
jgi:methyl-accepting chemotaxis protein